jgi:8-amino-7-oxononanoate synthase
LAREAYEQHVNSSTSYDLFRKCRNYTDARDAIAGGYYPYFIPLEGSEDTEVFIDGQKRIMIGSNNYLGLTHHPKVMEAAESAARKYGTGCTGSRFLNGTLDLHEELESQLAEFVGKESALVFSTGFQTNLGTIASLVGREDVVVIDKLDHASIVDGCRLAYGKTFRFRHNDMDDLEQTLTSYADNFKGKLIVVDGIYSMEGDMANLPGIVKIADRHGANIMVDEAHSIGVVGPNGAGVAEHFGVSDRVDLIMGTFSKSFASIGGFVAGDEVVLQYIKHKARPMIFSAGLPPYAVATVHAALEIIRSEPERRETLMRHAKKMREGFRSLGFDTGGTETPVVPIIIGGLKETIMFWKALFEGGVFTNPVVPPAVPSGSCRIRTSCIATHTDSQLDQVLSTFEKIGREMGIIS